jgi:hypothetical protein
MIEDSLWMPFRQRRSNAALDVEDSNALDGRP